MNEPEARLDSLDKDEWWDVCRRLRPDITREEYEVMWADFQQRKSEGMFERDVQ